MFNTFRLAADARKAEAILRPHFYGGNWTLPTLAQNAVATIQDRDATCRQHFARILELADELAAANAKIARMTSGLRRGAKKPA